jgi:hypothetical protein
LVMLALNCINCGGSNLAAPVCKSAQFLAKKKERNYYSLKSKVTSFGKATRRQIHNTRMPSNIYNCTVIHIKCNRNGYT